MRRLTTLVAVTGTAIATMAGAATAAPPTRIDLPTGWQPEGIALHKGHLLVGSIPTGAIRKVDPRDGSQETIVPPRPEEASTIGLKADAQDRIFAAGGRTGKAFVYNARNGRELRTFTLNGTGDAFINDVVLFGSFAYFTDSRQAAVFEVRRNLSGVRRIPTPGIPVPATGNAANGIAATEDGRWLIVVAGGLLYRVDRFTGGSTQIAVDPEFTRNGDGLLLRGHRLLVVQNRLNRIADILLTPRYDGGALVRTLSSPEFDVPTTVARKGDDLFLPNARFGIAGPESAAFWITRVPAG